MEYVFRGQGHCAPGPTEEEIDENRREMFSGFGELEP
jgi:hypothetical protein